MFGALLLGRAAPLASLGTLQVLAVLLFALVFGGAGLVQPDRDRLFRVLDLFAAAGFELPMLELVHDALDGFLLRLRLVGRHRLTSLYQMLCGNRRRVIISSGIS